MSLPPKPVLSVVIPFNDEAENLQPLISEVHDALNGRISYELVCVDDGSCDGTADALHRARASNPLVRVLQHSKQCGQSTALRTGVKAAHAPWIATLDGDGQNDPADIPKLFAVVQDPKCPQDLQLVIGMRRKRFDSAAKRYASRIANAVRVWMLEDDSPDSGCGLKLFRRDVFLDLPYFDHMHRFVPALVKRNGGIVKSVPVNHRARERGSSHYGIFDRLGDGILDLLGVMWLCKRACNPIVEEWRSNG
ncbi:MAG: glycosyltransferase family 2 protein [Chromatiaceae bacterium]|nr:glycosyltransferase family 2 protein [Chromatiaceae bacterium]